MSFGRLASWAKLMSLGRKLTVLVCHSYKKVNKAKELNYLSINIGMLVKSDKTKSGNTFVKNELH